MAIPAVLSLLAGCGAGTLVVDAGEDQEHLLGASFELEALAPGSEDALFEWSVRSQPVGAQADLQARGSRATLTPDLPGTYELSVTATADRAEGSDAVRLTVLPNSPPIAIAGPDRVVALGASVELDGRASHDPDLQDLAFSWSVVSAPANSVASLSKPTSRTPHFVADVPGRYTLELAVHDGGFTATDQVTIVTNREPVADAGPDLTGQVGQPVTLDGRRSVDPDDDPMTFAWSLTSVPAGSSGVTLHDGDGGHAHFIPDVPGSYLVELVVSDGMLSSTARINVQVLPLTGVVGSVVYVSPSGNDSNPGTELLPLATIAAALTKVEQVEQLYRIQLAAGTYAEAFGHLLQDLTVELIGPASSEAKLVGPATLFELRGTSRMSLVQVSLNTPDVAVIGRGSETYIGLTNVNCVSRTCVQAGQFLSFNGGTVSVQGSTLKGHGEGTGISQVFGQVSVRDTGIEGHEMGISSINARLLVRDSNLRDNLTTGIHLFANSSVAPILVENVAISGSQIGLQSLAAPNVQMVGGSIYEGETGVVISGGALSLRSVTMSQLQVGVEMGGIVNTGEVVTMRHSILSSLAGPAIIVNHAKGFLDLGDASMPGDNQLSSSIGRAVWDKRPAGATGLITFSHTRLNGQPIPPGTYTGPSNLGAFTIVGTGNEVYVY